jgi:glycosyltransferase involved in cell wall biosynthesis
MLKSVSSDPTTSVIHVLRAPVGGLFRHVRDLVGAQSAAGMAVGVICDRASADELTVRRLAEMAPKLALGLERVPMARDVGPRDVQAWAAVRSIAHERGAQTLHGHGAKGGAYARLAAAALRRSGRDVAGFYTPHGGSLHYSPSSVAGRVFMGLERLLAPMSSGIIFESEFARRTFVARVGRPQAPMVVIPNGVAADEFADLPPGPRDYDFVFVGELRKLKGVDVLIAATARLNSQRPVSLLIVGDGPDWAELEQQVALHGLQSHVMFAGARPAREAFQKGRVLVVPSRAESLPYVVLEAAAAGLPVIATDVGGIPEIVADTGVGLVPPDDVDALTEAMRAALADEKTAAAGAARLRAAVALRFTIDAMSQSVMAFYAEHVRA